MRLPSSTTSINNNAANVSTMLPMDTFLGIPDSSLPTLVQGLYGMIFTIIASLALYIWDMLLTLDQEILYIWRSKKSLITVLFVFMRFLALGGQMAFLVLNVSSLSGTGSFCRGYVWFQGVLALVMFAGIDFLLIARVYAFYGCNKYLLGFLVAFDILNFAAVAGLISVGFPKFRVVPNPAPGKLHVGICIPIGYPNIEPDLWVPIFAFQSVLFGLVLARHIYDQYGESNVFKSLVSNSGPTSVYHIFIRDGFWVYFALFLDLLLCVIGNQVQSIVGPIAIQWSYCVIGICCSRLILNLRAAGSRSISSFSQYE